MSTIDCHEMETLLLSCPASMCRHERFLTSKVCHGKNVHTEENVSVGGDALSCLT